jgi:hypothetical protein
MRNAPRVFSLSIDLATTNAVIASKHLEPIGFKVLYGKVFSPGSTHESSLAVTRFEIDQLEIDQLEIQWLFFFRPIFKPKSWDSLA